MSAQSQSVLQYTVERHCDDHASSDQNYSHQFYDQSPSYDGCDHCNDCLACYLTILHDQLNVAFISSQPVLAIATIVLYLAPANLQPNKPPIS